MPRLLANVTKPTPKKKLARLQNAPIHLQTKSGRVYTARIIGRMRLNGKNAYLFTDVEPA